MQKDTIKLTTIVPLLRDMLARDIVDDDDELIRRINVFPSPLILSSNSSKSFAFQYAL